MIDVEQLKRQHAEIEEVMAGAMRVIGAGEVSSEATMLTAMLADISRLIGSHLAIEDSDVYPILVESMDPDVSRTARQFRDNMSGIAQELKGYAERYQQPADITGDIARFGYETRRIFERVRYRMRREENDLYPLLVHRQPATAAPSP